MCSGVVPQHPPTTATPIASSSRARSARNAGVSSYTVRPPTLLGSPALAWITSGSAVAARKARAMATMCSMPLPQLEPTASAPAAASPAAAWATLTPITVK